MAVAVPSLLAAVVGPWLWHRRRHQADPRQPLVVRDYLE
jgi:hypothetical protein